MEEIWKPVVGYEGLYEVSNVGVIKKIGMCENHEQPAKKIMKCWKSGEIGNQYMSIGLSKNSKNINYLIHRLVARAFIPNPQDKPFINHIDNNTFNNNISNLEWCTHEENMRHMRNQKRNKKISLSMITTADIPLIRNYKSKSTYKDLMAMFKVSHSQIVRIRNRSQWKFV